MLTTEQRAKLNANLPPDKIREREGPGGRALSYVEGWDAIDVLNEIVGQGEWGYDCTASIACPLEERPGKFGMQWCITYTCRCVLTIRGCMPIADYGVGHGKEKDPGLSVESAIKEAATDALKRCAKSLGHRLGLALYDKRREHVGDPEPQRPAKSLTAIAPVVAAFDALVFGDAEKLDRYIEKANSVQAGLSSEDHATVGAAVERAQKRVTEPTKPGAVDPKRAMMTAAWTFADCRTAAELGALVMLKLPKVNQADRPAFKTALRARAFDLGCPEKVDGWLGVPVGGGHPEP